MKGGSGLADSLKGYLGWNKARMVCFVRMLLGLFAVRTVNLTEIALAMEGKAKASSRYRRLQRFFSSFNIDFVQIARWIFQLYVSPEDKFYLVIDRTNWFFGKQKINVFMLGIAHEGRAIPLFWTLLPKAGSSNFKEQKQLICMFLETFGIDKIQGLLADREFASGRLFKWLNQKSVPFYIRIKEGSLTRIKEKKFVTAKKIFNDLSSKTKKEFHTTVRILRHELP